MEVEKTMFMSAIMGCSRADKNLVKSLCEPSGDKEFCLRSLESEAAVMEASDKIGALTAMLKMMIRNATAFVKEEQKKSAAMRECASCHERYVDLLELAFLDLAQHDLMSAKYEVFVAGDRLNECEQRVSNDPVVVANDRVLWRCLVLGSDIIN